MIRSASIRSDRWAERHTLSSTSSDFSPLIFEMLRRAWIHRTELFRGPQGAQGENLLQGGHRFVGADRTQGVDRLVGQPVVRVEEEFCRRPAVQGDNRLRFLLRSRAAVAVRATVSSGKKERSQRAVTAEGWGILESALIASFFTRRSGWESVAATCGARSGIPRVPRTVIMFRTMYQRESVRFSRIVGTATLPIRVTISTIAFRTSRSSSSARAWRSGPTERSSSATSPHRSLRGHGLRAFLAIRCNAPPAPRMPLP